MRNLRKFTAVVIAIALVLTSMTTAFAASTYEFEAQASVLKDLGIWQGDVSGDLMLGKDLTRAEGAVLVLKTVLGKTDADKDAADASSIADFADADKVPTWATKWVALAVEEGVIKGSNNNLNAAAPLLGKDLASMYMNALGFGDENKYAEAVELLAAKATVDPISAAIPADEALLRDAATAIVFDALTAIAKDAKETVIVNYVGKNADLKAIAEKAGLIVAPPAPAEVAVESIKAINAKQIEVKFNKDMDKDSAETESFYSVKDKGGATETTLSSGSASLVDSKTVVITLDNSITDKLSNSSTAKVKVKKDIKAADGKKLAADKEFDVVVQDGILPTVTKVEATGEKTIKITFSEPVYGSDTGTYGSAGNFKDNFVVKSGTYTYFVQSATISGLSVSLDIGTSLIEGPVVVTVNKDGSTATSVQDYAGYKVFKGDSTFSYVKDTSVSQVSIADAKPNEVKLKFSKPVKAADLRLFHSVKTAGAYASAPVTTNLNYVDTITFTFTNPVPAGDITFFLVNSTVGGNELVDGYGVKVPDQTLTAKVVADVTGPVVSSTEVLTNTGFKITFDEAITTSSIDKKNFTFKSVSDGKDVFYNISNDADRKVITLTVPGNLADNTQYQVVVKNAEDMYGNKMSAEATFTFTTGDNTPPTVNMNDCYSVASEGKIYIFFSEPMNEAQMLDKNNYAVATNGAVSTIASLGNDDTVTKLSEKAVVIDMVSSVNQPQVKIAPIMDLAGKRLGNSLDAIVVKNNAATYAASTGIKDESVLIESAKLIAKNKVKVTFDKELSSFANTDIVFTTNGSVVDAIRIQAVESQVKNSDGKTEVVLVLDKELATNATFTGTNVTCASITTPNSVSVSGTKLLGSQQRQVGDFVAPEVAKISRGGSDVPSVVFTTTAALNASGKVVKNDVIYIDITFTENIKAATLSTLTFKVEGFTVTAINNASDTNVIRITASANDDVTPFTTVTHVYNITDASPNANVFASGSVWNVTQ